MTPTPRHVKPPAFVKETGRTRQTFYNILKQMKAVGVAPPEQKTIDMECSWMVNWLATDGMGQRKAPSDIVAPGQQGQKPTDEPPDGDNSDEPDLARLMYLEQLGKVNKVQLDNAIKAKSVVARKIVQFMIDKIDEAFVRIILDGESSFVPELCSKIRRGIATEKNGGDPYTDEDAKKFWRVEMRRIIAPVKPYMIRLLKKHDSE